MHRSSTVKKKDKMEKSILLANSSVDELVRKCLPPRDSVLAGFVGSVDAITTIDNALVVEPRRRNAELDSILIFIGKNNSTLYDNQQSTTVAILQNSTEVARWVTKSALSVHFCLNFFRVLQNKIENRRREKNNKKEKTTN